MTTMPYLEHLMREAIKELGDEKCDTCKHRIYIIPGGGGCDLEKCPWELE